MKKIFSSLLILISLQGFSQAKIDSLTVDLIMRDPKWIGTSPSRPYWSVNSKYLFFSWNPEKLNADSVYFISADNLIPKKAPYEMQQAYPSATDVSYNDKKTAYTYTKHGDVYFAYANSPAEKRITQTTEIESNARCILDNRIVYTKNQNLFCWNMLSGETIQLTNFLKGRAPDSLKKTAHLSSQEKWLKQQQLETSEVLKKRKFKRELTEAKRKAQSGKELQAIYYEDKLLDDISISPDGRFVCYTLTNDINEKTTIVPSYVTETGFTEDISSRSKVGAAKGTSEFYIFDREKDTVMLLKTDSLPGIRDVPHYIDPKDTGSSKPRHVTIYGLYWNRQGTNAILEIRSADNKDRWITLLKASSAQLELLDRQRDEAWIGGPAVDYDNNIGWISEDDCWFESEASGYAHLYRMNVRTKQKLRLTNGNFEVEGVKLSDDKKYFYFSSNEINPGEQQYYRLAVNGSGLEKLTNMAGAHQVLLSPDLKMMADIYSYSNRPWELFLQETNKKSKPMQVTNKAQSEEFRSYAWQDPEIIQFKARDSATVYARLYLPATQNPLKPAVIFVHGAGYLQNAHKWWSYYFREYMFHNLLADKGYTVLDIDYRGSAGYGRDWRTGIYRYMGGKDLDDEVDGAKLLVKNYGIDPKRIGIYGGSYGGFLTLMAMFTQQEVFVAGAALRSVTDWAHYNHEYTSNILNEPFTDSVAYKRSSPIYYAEGLKGALLMCHGMIDVNVHFQDIVRLTQRLIELKKEHWELAVYPLEDHGFIDPTSWTDEYKRIFKLFETNLKR